MCINVYSSLYVVKLLFKLCDSLSMHYRTPFVKFSGKGRMNFCKHFTIGRFILNGKYIKFWKTYLLLIEQGTKL